jgi:hypothetical protein
MMHDLVEAGADPNVLTLGARVCEDEDRHARMCLEIASSYAGRTIEAQAARHPQFAPLDGIKQPLRASLRVLGMCCIGETLAAVWMDRSYDATTVSSLRPWVRQHFADEVHHAQLGWAHFASTRVPPGAREAASRWLVPLVQANLNAWLAPDEHDLSGIDGHGIPTADENYELVRAALSEIVIPGCDRVGIDTTALREQLPSMLRRTDGR